jgi:hypothetical protein
MRRRTVQAPSELEAIASLIEITSSLRRAGSLREVQARKQCGHIHIAR